MKKWIWQQEGYPNFTYDVGKLEMLLQKISLEQGYLIALSQTMNQNSIVQRQCEALLSETLSTAAIEGKMLNRESVKASIAKKFGFAEVDFKKINDTTDNLVAILIDANTHYEEDLTLDRLFGWHHALFPRGMSGLHKITTAMLRGEETMQIIGGYLGSEDVYYEAPPRKDLDYEMQRFLDWFNTTQPSLIKACIVHLWFVIIHPFEDGNGRITRAITDLVLSKIETSKLSKLYSMSSIINEERASYYKVLEQTTGYIKKVDKHLDITLWCEWFLNTLYKALLAAKSKLNHIVQKTQFWDKHRHKNLNARQSKVLNFILDIGVNDFKGNISKKKYMSIANAASTTASRDLAELLALECIKQIEGTAGRNVSYAIVF